MVPQTQAHNRRSHTHKLREVEKAQGGTREEVIDNSATEVIALTAHAQRGVRSTTVDLTLSLPLRHPLSNKRGKRIRAIDDVNAHAAIRCPKPSAVTSSNAWLLDTGASRHMTGLRRWFRVFVTATRHNHGRWRYQVTSPWRRAGTTSLQTTGRLIHDYRG